MQACLPAFVILLLGLSSPAAGTAGSSLPALEIRPEAVASSPVVALGRDVVVSGEVRSDVAALNGSARIGGSVRGDVIVFGGDVHLDETARVEGGVFVLGGRAHLAPGAQVHGRTVAYPEASQALMSLIEGPSFGLPASASIVIATKTALLTAWLALVLLFFTTSGRQVQQTAQAVQEMPLRSFFTGLTGILALVLTALFLSSLTGPLVALPLLVLVVLFLLLVKLWGMVAVFYAVGGWLLRAARRREPPLIAATVGLVALGLLKFVPHVGAMVWMLATVIGVGATLTTKFGSRQPWFPGTGFPGTGLPGTGLPGTRLPGTGFPGTGFPGT